jgi:hypothetical protein
MDLIEDFRFLNGEYILKEFYNLNNMNDILKWSNENIHLPGKTIVRIMNYGFIYYINEIKYLQNEIINLLDNNKKKLGISITKDELKKELQNYLEKNIKNKDNIGFL